jgi:hypothetical protein
MRPASLVVRGSIIKSIIKVPARTLEAGLPPFKSPGNGLAGTAQPL